MQWFWLISWLENKHASMHCVVASSRNAADPRWTALNGRFCCTIQEAGPIQQQATNLESKKITILKSLGVGSANEWFPTFPRSIEPSTPSAGYHIVSLLHQLRTSRETSTNQSGEIFPKSSTKLYKAKASRLSLPSQCRRFGSLSSLQIPIAGIVDFWVGELALLAYVREGPRIKFHRRWAPTSREENSHTLNSNHAASRWLKNTWKVQRPCYMLKFGSQMVLPCYKWCCLWSPRWGIWFCSGEHIREDKSIIFVQKQLEANQANQANLPLWYHGIIFSPFSEHCSASRITSSIIIVHLSCIPLAIVRLKWHHTATRYRCLQLCGTLLSPPRRCPFHLLTFETAKSHAGRTWQIQIPQVTCCSNCRFKYNIKILTKSKGFNNKHSS